MGRLRCWCVARTGEIVDVNIRCLEMFGYTREELIGANLEILVPLRHQAAHKGHRDRYSKEPRPRPMDTGRDLWGLRKDGSEVLVEIDLGHGGVRRTHPGCRASFAIGAKELW